MDNTDKMVGGIVGTVLSGFGASLSLTEIQAIVGIVCTVLGFLITIVTTVIIPLVKKIKKAKEDGKITIEEAEDIANSLQDGLNKTKEEIDKISKK